MPAPVEQEGGRGGGGGALIHTHLTPVLPSATPITCVVVAPSLLGVLDPAHSWCAGSCPVLVRWILPTLGALDPAHSWCAGSCTLLVCWILPTLGVLDPAHSWCAGSCTLLVRWILHTVCLSGSYRMCDRIQQIRFHSCIPIDGSSRSRCILASLVRMKAGCNASSTAPTILACGPGQFMGGLHPHCPHGRPH